ncbi:hypothetical protein H8356DRAFT_1355140 [Neocallimastix lanati (nom. inval.)]|nr:hypothetical protein H8356DRAFT_1355140 [Neocallimastix sp. JGI-2020a]
MDINQFKLTEKIQLLRLLIQKGRFETGVSDDVDELDEFVDALADNKEARCILKGCGENNLVNLVEKENQFYDISLNFKTQRELGIIINPKSNEENNNNNNNNNNCQPTFSGSASIVTAERGIETQKGENSIGLHYLTKKNIFIREVRTIYTFNGKNSFNIIGHGQCSNFTNTVIRIVFSDSNKLTLFITKVFGYRPGNNSSAFNVSTHEGAGTFQALANKELTSPKANWASGL